MDLTNLKGWDELDDSETLRSFDEGAEQVHTENNSKNYKVADWRVVRPVYNNDFCIHCQFCWVYCPDTAIIPNNKKFGHIDMDHCKGCGICAEVCPTNPKSLIMFKEEVSKDEALAKWPAKEVKEKV